MRAPAVEQRPSVREWPMLFSGPMVRGILSGQKTQTRRVVSDLNSVSNFKASELLLHDPRTFSDDGPSPAGNAGPYLHAYVNAPLIETRRKWKQGDCDPAIMERLYPRYQVGGLLWVKETFFDHGDDRGRITRLDERVEYRATEWDRKGDGDAGGWTPSIHMPRWASRLTLEITELRVERLCDISKADAWAEGVTGDPELARENWLADDFAAPLKDANPFVWCISFQSVAAPQPGTRPQEGR